MLICVWVVVCVKLFQVESGDSVTVMVTLQRDVDEDADPSTLDAVVCPRFPTARTEGWWLIVGDNNSNSLLSIKRLNIGAKAKVIFVLSFSLYCFSAYCVCRLLRRNWSLLPLKILAIIH